MLTYVNASDCTQGLYGQFKRVRTESWLGDKSLIAPGTQTCVSVVPWLFSQTLYQLSILA